MNDKSTYTVFDTENVDPITSSTYPEKFREAVSGRVKRRLSSCANLEDISVIMTELPPGVCNSLRVWQSHEEEFVYVLQGTPTLVTDDGERELRPGEFVGFPAGGRVGHHFVNQSESVVRFLEFANVVPENVSNYTAHDLQLAPAENGRGRIFVNRAQVPY